MIACLALCIGWRLYDIQILRCEELRERADDQHEGRLVVPATRGAIVDRHGRLLALSRESRSLFAHPRRIHEPERAAELLAPVLGKRRDALRRMFQSGKSFVYIQRFLDPEVADRVDALNLPEEFDGAFGFEPEPRRVYPLDELAVHVVGFATIDGKGVEGIELQYDEALKGDPRIYVLLRDGHADVTRRLVSEPRKKPSDVVLTLDVVLQHIVERELDRAVRKHHPKGASAVLLDPRSGEVLALANRPTVDANRFGSVPAGYHRNRAVTDRYEPGSTFKVVTMSAAFELGKVRTNQRIFCERGVYNTGSRIIRDISPQGSLTPGQILIKSSNIGMSKIVLGMTPDELHDSITAFGFGRPTGIELPGESGGYLRPVEQWSGYSQASLAFGQEISVTAVQMASAIASIANGGTLIPPRIVLGTRGPNGKLHRSPTPRARRVVSAETSRIISRMMEDVVKLGHDHPARVTGYRVAGKTGTAQKFIEGVGYSDTEYVPSFGGFAPVSDPQLVLLVVIDTPRGKEYLGGKVAAPVFGRIMTEALRYLRVPSEDPSAPYTTVGGQTLVTRRMSQ
jgi:cell division protein FtsI/penicillin-binding protein 2